MQQIKTIIDQATKLHVANINNTENYSIEEVYNTNLQIEDHKLHRIIQKYELNFQEQVILLLTLAPYFNPQSLDILLAKNPNFDTICTEFGGVTKSPHRGVLPTGETAVFLLAARDVNLRKEVAKLLLPDSKLSRNLLVFLETVDSQLPPLSGRLLISEELQQELMYGQVLLPKLSQNFPAELLETNLDWKDLIISKNTEEQLRDLKNWLLYQKQLSEHPTLGKRTKQGFRTLFHGPPGTGKTLTATLLGKYADQPVFRIDLSLMVSKYIGETEKNLAGIFKRAEHKDWILFFDEADALFGRRTDNETANDRFANQEVAYLLQRIENYNGMVILASNLKNHLDKAFMRRFQSVVHFPKPDKTERKLIWNKTLPADLPLDPTANMEILCDRYEVTAAQISNIVQACYIDAIAAKATMIEKSTLKKNLRNELRKEDLLFEDYL
ncbi:MAG: ATP-binding protein [Bacteroidota bacterium]